MSGDSYDVQGEVRDALNTAVDSYGKRVLGDPRVLGNLVTDLLPDLPRERSLLVTAAEAGIAGELTQNVEGQHMDADTAVALAARSLAENRSLEPGASMWVAAEYAKALGYQVRSQAASPWENAISKPPPDNPAAGHDQTLTTNQPVGGWQPVPAPPDPWPPAPQAPQNPWPQTPASAPGPTQQEAPTQHSWPRTPAPGAGQWQPAPAPAPGAGQWQPPPASGPGPWQPTPPGPGPGPGPWAPAPAPPKSRRGLFIGGGVVLAVIVVAVVIVALLGSSSSSSTPLASPKHSTSPSPHPTASTATPSVSPTAALAALPAGVKALKVLLPYDIQDANTECVEQAKIPWTNPGLVRGLECTAPDVPGGQIFGYQLDSTANYLQAWANYNSWAQFGTSSTLDCPPAAGDAQGGPGEWWGPRFAKRAGQVLECFTSKSGPVYVWTYPTEDAFIVVQPPKSWTFSKLETWWEDNAV